MSSAKCWPFCLDLNVLIGWSGISSCVLMKVSHWSHAVETRHGYSSYLQKDVTTWKYFPHCWPWICEGVISVFATKKVSYVEFVFSLLLSWTSCWVRRSRCRLFKTPWRLCVINLFISVYLAKSKFAFAFLWWSMTPVRQISWSDFLFSWFDNAFMRWWIGKSLDNGLSPIWYRSVVYLDQCYFINDKTLTRFITVTS